MLTGELIGKIKSGAYDGAFRRLYGDTAAARERYIAAVESYKSIYDEGDVTLYSAPGRTEVGGNHTDHQHGKVLAGSVNLDVIAVAGANGKDTVAVKSEGYPEDVVTLRDLSPKADEEGKAAALVRGMCSLARGAGYPVAGFNAYTTSNVLKGSGLSSSAAFEVLLGNIISGLFCRGGISPVEIAKMGQKAENVFFGKPCGLMDQTASSVGGFTSIDFADPANPVIDSVSFDLAAAGYSLCIVNTGGNHADLTADYAGITEECRSVARFFGKEVLHDVPEEAVLRAIPELRAAVGDRAVLRALHFFRETVRAGDEATALKEGRFADFLRLVRESGESSYKYLQNVYSPENPGEQGLSLALCLAESVLGERGAARVHGGGFAGTIQSFVPGDLLDSFRREMEAVFGAGQVYTLSIRPVGGVAVTEDL